MAMGIMASAVMPPPPILVYARMRACRTPAWRAAAQRSAGAVHSARLSGRRRAPQHDFRCRQLIFATPPRFAGSRYANGAVEAAHAQKAA